MEIKTGRFERLAGNDYFVATSPLLWINEFEASAVHELLISHIKDNIEKIDSEKVTTMVESIASCAIERINKDDDLVFHYNEILEKIEDKELGLSFENLFKLHKELMLPNDNRSGKFRDMNVRIGDFYPAPYWEVSRLMEDFFLFVNKKDLDPFIKCAIAHAYFESIHPFYDGNGRIGRILILWMLINDNVLEVAELHPSVWFLNNQQEYYDLLSAYSRSGAVGSWVEFFLRAIKTKLKNSN